MRLRHLAFAAALALGIAGGVTVMPVSPVMAETVALGTIADVTPTEWTRRRGRRYRGYRGYRSGYRRRYRSYRSSRYRRGSYARRRGGDRGEARPAPVEARQEAPATTTRPSRPASNASRPTFDYGGVRR